jgi:hypothetical protein
MNYSVMDDCMQALFEQYVPLSQAQRERLSQFCCSQILAGSSQLSKLAGWLGRTSKQTYREQWLRRLVQAPFVRQEYVYEPWLKQALQGYTAGVWHLVLDRSSLVSREVDLAMVALAYRRRAIPLKWLQIPYGGAGIDTYITLLNACKPLLPSNVAVTVHGDAEFGAIPMLHFVRRQNGHFILGQRSHYQVRPTAINHWQALADFPMSKTRGLYLQQMVLTKEHRYWGVTLFGFRHPNQSGQDEKRFYATSLPLTASLRRLGKRRWAIEPCFQDFKSSGWHLHQSQLRDATAREGLLVLLSCTYLWLTCIGRWLCKTGQRQQVDAHAVRQLSYFRLGRDWLVHQFRHELTIPHLLTLYS